MHRKLEEIVSRTKEDLLKRKNDQKPRDFIKAIKNPNNGSVAIIAEVKLASPTEDKLGEELDIQDRVKEYELAGADCISYVTERYFFKGDPAFIEMIKQMVKLPILQKDFIIDPYQLYEAKKAAADAILLIARILSKQKLISLVYLAKEIGIEPVVEINDEEDLKKALQTKTQIIAVNARNLDTFEVNVDKACQLLKKISGKFIKLGFSGIHTRVEVEKYKKAGVKAVLVGTELMKTKDINKKILELKNASFS